MSANVDFNVASSGGATGPTAAAGEAKKDGVAAAVGPVSILPHSLLINMQGRRVTVLLSAGKGEVEGMLRTVDAERGDLLLEDVVHFSWEATRSGGANDDKPSLPAGMRPCAVGGGARRVLGRYDVALVNSRFIDLITPTLFGDGDEVITDGP